MKNKNIFILFVLTLFMTSCVSDLADLNKSPNTAANANPQQVLTSAQGYLGWMLDGEYNRRSFMWAQYWTWGPGVAMGDAERYVAAGTNYNNVWIRGYSNALTDLKFVSNSTSKAHSGAAKILTAYIYQGLVDHFGDIPYTEALNGELEDGSVFSPKFDDDEAIYADLPNVIDAGLADLASASAGSMGAEDLVFGGDIKAWIKFGNSLKLRVLLRQADVKDVSAAVKALVSSGSFIETTSDIADIAFGGSSGDENPMFARMESGVKNFYVASNTSVDYLSEIGDPRLNAFYAPAVNTGTIVSIAQGSIDNEPFTAGVNDYSQMTPILYGNSNSVILMSDWEVWLLRAEAAARYGTSDDDVASFNSGVTSSFNYLSVTGAADYLSTIAYTSGDALDSKLNKIGIQKWIAMNGLQDDEGWIETRRFKIFHESILKKPALSVMPDGVHPTIWLYPANELTFNPNAPVQRDLNEKVFWDK